MDRQDSLRPAGSSRLDILEDRFDRFETQHRTNEQTCSTATQAEADVQALGELYNSLDDQVENINRAAEERMASIDGRIDGIEKQLRMLQASKGDASESLPRSDHVTSRRQDETIDTAQLDAEIALQHTAIISLTKRIQQLEATRPSPILLDARSPHQLAQALIQQLNHGDVLSAADNAELQIALGTPGALDTSALPDAVPSLPRSPPLTASNTRQSSTVVDGQLPQPKKRGRPSNSSKGSASEGHPPNKVTKRGRSPPSAPSIENKTTESASRTAKPSSRGRGRGRGRRLQSRAQSTRRHSDLSTRSDGSAQSQVSSVFDDTQGTTTPLVPEYARFTPPIPVMSSNLHVSEQANLPNVSESVLALAAQGPIRATDAQARNAQDLANPNQNTTGVESHQSSDPLIPAERRSERTHKPTKLFGDQIHWKQANRQMRGQFGLSPAKTQPTGARFTNL